MKRLDIQVSVVRETDVLVCGGGPAGVAAAIAAARHGKKVTLIERYGCLGGVATSCLVGIWLGSYSRDGAYPVIGGIFNEIVERMAAEGGAIRAGDDVAFGTRHLGYASWHGRTVPFEYECCKRVLEHMVLEAGVNICYFTSLIEPKVLHDRIDGVFIHSANGIEYIQAQVFIDSTGDAALANKAGCPTIKGREEDGLMSPPTLIFTVDGVDSIAFENYCRSTGDVRFHAAIAEFEKHNNWPFAFKAINCCEMMSRGNFFINTGQIVGIDGTNADDITNAMVIGRKQSLELMEILKQIVPGFSKARLVQTAPMLGVRDTRRIIGQYTLTVQDVIQGVRFNDTIALSGYQWDMADPKNPTKQRMEDTVISRPYAEIPYRSLVPKKIINLIVAGRSVSCQWDVLGLFRIMPACFAMGQAAGTAANIAVNEGFDFKNVESEILRKQLLADKAILQCA